MKIEIKHRWLGSVLFSLETESVRLCLEEAVKSKANLYGANLYGANLGGADLGGTVLDPSNAPNHQAEDFTERDGEWVIGYRTRETSAAGRKLQDDRIYGCEVFSTADTECHPGWYLWPSLETARNFSSNVPMVQVKAREKDIHHAGTKWRSRAIWIIGGVE